MFIKGKDGDDDDDDEDDNNSNDDDEDDDVILRPVCHNHEWVEMNLSGHKWMGSDGIQKGFQPKALQIKYNIM